MTTRRTGRSNRTWSSRTPQLVGRGIRVVQQAARPHVQVDRRRRARAGERLHHALQRVERAAEVLLARVCGDQVDPPALEGVVRVHRAPVAGLDAGERPQVANAVEPTRQHLEHHLAHDGRRLLEPWREQLRERLRARDERRRSARGGRRRRGRAPASRDAPPSSRRRRDATARTPGDRTHDTGRRAPGRTRPGSGCATRRSAGREAAGTPACRPHRPAPAAARARRPPRPPAGRPGDGT